MKQIKNILVYGSGLMGKGTAMVFSKLPVNITMFDVAWMDVHSPMRASFKQLTDRGIIPEAEAEERLSRIRFTTELDDPAIAAADFVIENVFEDMQLKRQVFAQLEEACRADCIFSTNTSVMSPTEISAELQHKERFVGVHFWNPAHLIPLVEVVSTASTAPETAQTVMQLLNECGKKAVLCKKDVPGFIANRMQHALWREAISIVERGIADAKTVDEAVKYSFGLRLFQLPPLENADMVGLDLAYNVHEYLLPHLEDSHSPSPLLTEAKARGELGYKSGKGFFEHTPEQAASSKAELNEYLIRMLYPEHS